jgi:hypothetical protein
LALSFDLTLSFVILGIGRFPGVIHPLLLEHFAGDISDIGGRWLAGLSLLGFLTSGLGPLAFAHSGDFGSASLGSLAL